MQVVCGLFILRGREVFGQYLLGNGTMVTKGSMHGRTTQLSRWWILLGLSGASVFSLGLVIFPDLLFAGVFIKSPPRYGPAPLIGMGLPVAGAVVAVVLAARRYRRRH
jgi:hypothetical protein